MTRAMTKMPKTLLTGFAVAIALGAMVPDAAASGGRDPGDIADQKRLLAESRARDRARGNAGESFFSRIFGGDSMESSEAAKDAKKIEQ
ncbi:MAG: hypothetical protein AAF698_10580 [Pseudomonadota bacterium]